MEISQLSPFVNASSYVQVLNFFIGSMGHLANFKDGQIWQQYDNLFGT